MRRIAGLFCVLSLLALAGSLSGCGARSGGVSGPYVGGGGGVALGG